MSIEFTCDTCEKEDCTCLEDLAVKVGYDLAIEILSYREENDPADDEPFDIDDDHGMNPYDGTYDYMEDAYDYY